MRVQIDHLTHQLGEKTIFDDLSLDIQSGSSTVLIGPSGVGKTTLLRIIAGLTIPDEGKVRLDDRLVNNPESQVSPHQRGLSMVFQDLALWPHLNVLENVQLVSGDRQKAEVWLERVGWGGRHQDYPEQLSSGERQRVALARALAAAPRLLLLDEPLLNLDPISRGALLQVLMQLQTEEGFTLLYVTHYLEEAVLLGDRLIFLMNGGLELEGPLEEIMACSLSPELEHFLHLPGSAELISQLRSS